MLDRPVRVLAGGDALDSDGGRGQAGDAVVDLIRICGQLKLWDESLMEGVRDGQADTPAV